MGRSRANIVEVVDFMVLGPLRVEDAGQVVPLGGPKQRTVLALLVASPGRVVSMDSLLMGTYGLDADPRARRSIQTWISGYRRHLGDAIRRRDRGYVLDVDPLSIDAGRFEDRVRTAHDARHEDLAAELLREALALWRGRPYVDAEPTPVLDVEARRLEALRAEALDTRITLDLGAGKHRQLVPELETLVAERPHDEGLRAHHMVALYRCGRQADALRAYRQTEQWLRDELGVDPAPELRSLEHLILTQDRSLDYRPKVRTRPIPARYTSFVGRADDVEAVRGLVLGTRLVTITGAGGVGKSSLAIEVARSLIDELTTVFVPIEDNREADPWQAIATSMGVRGGGDADLPQLVRQTIGDTRLLLLLDGCEHLLDRLTPLVAELLASGRGTHILLASREPIAMTGERVFTLGPLDHGEGSASNRLFFERSGLDSTTLDAEAVQQVSAIGSRVSGLPLGVELAAARMRTLQLAEIAARLDDQPALLRTKRGAVPHQQSLVATLDWSYDLLTPESQAAFVRLGAFPTGSLAAEAVARVLDSDAPEEALAPLLDASLVTRPDDVMSAYSMLEPVRQYAAMRLTEAGGLAAARLRYAEWIVEVCSGVQVAGLEGDLWTATDMVRTHAPSIAATAAWAADNGHVEIVLGIVAGAGRDWPRVADPALLITPGLVAIDACEPVDEMLRLRALAHLAFLHTPFRPEGARRLLALLEAEASGEMDLLTEHVVLGAKAAVPYRLQRGQDADKATIRGWLALDEESVAAAVAMGYPAEPMLYNRALNLSLLGDLEGERAALNRLLAWAGDTRRMWRGMALHVIAKRQHLEGDPASAIESAREAARLLVDGGNLDFGAEAEYMLAHIYADQDEYAQAADALERVDEYHSQIGLPPAIEEEPDIVALVAAGSGNWDEFLVAARGFFDELPPVDEATARSRYLRGEPGDTSRVARMIPAVARYLAAHARIGDAARVLGAMEMAVRESVSPQTYDKVGLLDRVQRLNADIGSPAVEALPTSLEDLWSFMRAALQEEGE